MQLVIKYVARHWQGELNLWLSFLVNTLFLFFLVFFSFGPLNVYLAIDSLPMTRLFARVAFLAVITTLWVWQMVGVWRSGSKSKERGGLFISRWASRVIVLLVGYLVIGIYPPGFENVRRLHAMATDTDEFGSIGYSISVEGNELAITGGMTYGLIENFTKALDANPQIEVVVLNSSGGYGTVGRRIADQIGRRGLSTKVVNSCESACTTSYIAGRHRIMGRSARLGFHSTAPKSSETVGTETIIPASQELTIGYSRRAGVSEEFLIDWLKTPGGDIWYPSLDELLNANVVTDVID